MHALAMTESSACARALRTLIDLGEAGHIPWVMLRPRDLDDDGIFEGDFDFLIDGARFEEILRTVFAVCQAAGISFVLRQAAPFKRQIELLDEQARRVTVELWTHAEFRTRDRGGRLTRAGVGYAAYARMDAAGREALLAALFLLHLHHKGKDLGAQLVRERLAWFAQRMAGQPLLRDALEGLRAGTLDLEGARRAAAAFLRERDIPMASPARVALRRLAWELRRALHWPSWRTTAVVGPDGSGKGTLIDDIKQGPLGKMFRFQRFKRFFRRPLFYWVQREPRNVRDEKLLWLILPVAWTYFSLSRLFTGWRQPLVLDRYFYDYFVRNVRSPTQPLRRIAAYGACSALAPRPDRLIVASCPAATIHERKQEMTQPAIDAMYDMYVDQVTRGWLPLTLFCYTGGSPALSRLHVSEFLGSPDLA
jgi:hypothetical protein